jgi:methylthioribose-1-phosphate isomerase
MGNSTTVKTIRWKNNRVVMLDQRLLPEKEEYRVYRDYTEVARAIRDMVIRGAPAIGVAAAMGVALGALWIEGRNFDRELERIFAIFAKTRPTAVNLYWALNRMRAVYAENRSSGIETVKRLLIEEAKKIHAEDIATHRALGKLGAGLLKNASRVLTHCNAGALATAGYGTALGVLRAMKESGKEVEVLVSETRPFLQGARLTAWELKKEKIPATLVTDNMVGDLMQRNKVDAVVVGCDRVAANGDVANKIGTYSIAVLARHHRIPFFVACPTSTVDMQCPSGTAIQGGHAYLRPPHSPTWSQRSQSCLRYYRPGIDYRHYYRKGCDHPTLCTEYPRPCQSSVRKKSWKNCFTPGESPVRIGVWGRSTKRSGLGAKTDGRSPTSETAEWKLSSMR